MGRRTQALVGVGLLVAGLLCAYAGSVGAGRGIDWLADGAAFPAGLLFALAVVFLLRAALSGRARDVTYFGGPAGSPDAARDDAPPVERTLEILADEDQDRGR